MSYIKEFLKSQQFLALKVTLGRMELFSALFSFVLLLEEALFSHMQHYVKTLKEMKVKNRCGEDLL